MDNIKLMNKSQTYEVMDLWMRTTTHANPFVENNFWGKYYDVIKDKYIDEKDTYIYVKDDKVIAFTCVSEDNMIEGLFVDPEYQNRGIGSQMLDFLKSQYPILHIKIYAQNRKAFAFASKSGFIIDGAERHEHNNEVMYTMLWND